MERIRNLTAYQKGILLILLAMMVAFAVLYGVVSSRVGFLYQNKILVPSQTEGSTVYSGSIYATPTSFTVSPDKTVTFRWGDKVYGPYTAREDPSAVPAEHSMADYMTGIEIRKDGIILLRGGVLRLNSTSSDFMLYNERGELYGFGITATMSDGTVVDEEGKRVDPMEPSAYTILKLMQGPELTSKGQWPIWFLGMILSIVAAVSILYADELFRWRLSLRIQDPYIVDPSEWEIAGRYIIWTVFPIAILALYILGLIN